MKLQDNPVFRYGVSRYWRRQGYILWWMIVVAATTAVAFVVMVLRPHDWCTYLFLLAVLLNGPASVLLPALVPQILSREYEQQTFYALRLSRLSSLDIAAGKLAVALTPATLTVLITLPFSVILAGMQIVPVGLLLCVYYVGIAETIAVASLALWLAASRRNTAVSVLLTYLIHIVMPVPSLPLVLSVLAEAGHKPISSHTYPESLFAFGTVGMVGAAFGIWMLYSVVSEGICAYILTRPESDPDGSIPQWAVAFRDDFLAPGVARPPDPRSGS